MKKIALIVGTLLLAAVFPWAAQAQEENRTFRFALETEPFLAAIGYVNLGAEFYATDKIGIRAQAGSFNIEIGSYEYTGGFTQLGAAYYFAGVANSGGYVSGFAENQTAEVTTTTTTTDLNSLDSTTSTTTITGEGSALILGAMVGHRWQGERFYFRTGIGYGASSEVEVKLESSDGTESETYTLEGFGGTVADLALGIAF